MRINIIKERRLLGLSGRELARMLGVSQMRLRRWIWCKEAIPAGKLREMLRIFGCGSADDLLARK